VPLVLPDPIVSVVLANLAAADGFVESVTLAPDGPATPDSVIVTVGLSTPPRADVILTVTDEIAAGRILRRTDLDAVPSLAVIVRVLEALTAFAVNENVPVD